MRLAAAEHEPAEERARVDERPAPAGRRGFGTSASARERLTAPAIIEAATEGMCQVRKRRRQAHGPALPRLNATGVISCDVRTLKLLGS
jgi:hypothetical protein